MNGLKVYSIDIHQLASFLFDINSLTNDKRKLRRQWWQLRRWWWRWWQQQQQQPQHILSLHVLKFHQSRSGIFIEWWWSTPSMHSPTLYIIRYRRIQLSLGFKLNARELFRFKLPRAYPILWLALRQLILYCSMSFFYWSNCCCSYCHGYGLLLKLSERSILKYITYVIKAKASLNYVFYLCE